MKISTLIIGNIFFLIIAGCSPQKDMFSLKNIDINSRFVGKTVEESFYSKTLKDDWTYNIYYPANYDKNKNYPVIYLLHGAYGKYSDWKTLGEAQIILDRAIASQKIPPTIAIMPDGRDAWYSDIPNTNMRSAFEKDLFPYVETNFPVINKKDARAIGGLSMGGHGTLIFALRNPTYFSTAFVISPSITKLKKSPPKILKTLLEKDFSQVYNNPFSQEKWDEFSYHQAYQEYKNQDSKVRFFVTVGTDDIITPVEDSRDLVSNFIQDDVEHLYIEMPSGSHSWSFWGLMLGVALEYVGQEFYKK